MLPDGIHPAILEPLALVLAKPLAKLVCASQKSRILPGEWLTSLITPIHMRRNRNPWENYRPIVLTSILQKVMERVIKDLIVDYIKAHYPVRESQHGFMLKRSYLSLDTWTKPLRKIRREQSRSSLLRFPGCLWICQPPTTAGKSKILWTSGRSDALSQRVRRWEVIWSTPARLWFHRGQMHNRLRQESVLGLLHFCFTQLT